MTTKEAFYTRLKNLFGKNMTSQNWKELKIVAESLDASLLNKQLYYLYITSIGRKFVPKIAHLLTDLLSGIQLTLLSCQKESVKHLIKELDSLLEEDHQLPSIQKFIGEYEYDVNYLLAFFASDQVIAPYLSVLALAGKEDSDLQQEISNLAQLLRSRIIARKANECLVRSKAGAYENCAQSELVYLRELVNHYSIVSTMKSIPEVTKKMKVSQIKNILTECIKYGVERELDLIMKTQEMSLKGILDEIKDIFQDYPQGKVRKDGMKRFFRVVRKYF